MRKSDSLARRTAVVGKAKGGMSVEITAAELGISAESVMWDWRLARGRLMR